MKMKIRKAIASEVDGGMFRRGDSIYLDVDGEQYILSLETILGLEDMELRSKTTGSGNQ